MPEPIVPKEVAQDLAEALCHGDAPAAVAAAEAALASGISPLALLQGVLVPTLTEVGRRFEDLEIFLPELMAAGEAGRQCSRVLEEALVRGGGRAEPRGVIVLGTVKGDIHDIGKNIVGSLFKAHGFRVVDLGKDVPAARFIEAAEENRADVIAASALMSITRVGCRDVANLLGELGQRERYLLIVGGGSLDAAYAAEIGADGYAPSAAGAVELVKSLLAERKGV